MKRFYILGLKDFDQTDLLSLVGGKAANLGELAKSRLPTVEGFCITTSAYRTFLLSHQLETHIADILGDVDIDNLNQLNAASNKIQELFTKSALPSDAAQEIVLAYNALGHGPVAVRSSATAEDLPTASFAGQHESYLNIINETSLLNAIRQCWKSLWSPRAIQYRAKQGMTNSNAYMAVVIQKMLEPLVSGVMFTVNPLNGNPDQLVINAAYGLGEAIVSGAVSPDTFIINKSNLKVLHRSIQSKEIMVASHGGGDTKTLEVAEDKRAIPSLPDDALSKLGSLGKEVEAHFATPQDIEWAYARGEFFLLQARPITSQPKLKLNRVKKYNRLERLMLSFLLDYFPVPPYHFDRSLLLSLVDVTLEIASVFGLTPPKASEVMREESDGSLSLSPALPRLTWQTIPGLFKGILKSFYSLKIDPNVWVIERWPAIKNHIDEIQAKDVSSSTDEQVLSTIGEATRLRDLEIFASRQDYFFGGWIAMTLLPIFLRLISRKRWQYLYYQLMTDLEYPTSAMNRELTRLARLASNNARIRDSLKGEITAETWESLNSYEAGEEYLKECRAFLGLYGARTESLIAVPSSQAWEDKPHFVLSLIATLLRSTHGEREPLELQPPDFEIAYREGVTLAKRFPLNLLAFPFLFKFLVAKTRAMITERDWVIYAYELATRPLRRCMHELGRRLVLNGALRSDSDIRFLSIVEVENLLIGNRTSESVEDINRIIGQRKLARAKTQSGWKMPVKPQMTSQTGKVILKGTAASPGKTSGKARLILSENDFFSLQAGELLVCRATNPAWTPLFSIAAGVVADIGGPLSHAAIVAREYGIPAVLNTHNATSIMKEGRVYIVDGTHGHVLLDKSD